MVDARANLAYSTVAVAPSPASSGTTLSVGAGEGGRYPATPFNATVWPQNTMPTPANSEIVRVTAMVGDAITTMLRAQEGTSARAILVGDQIAQTITKKMLDDIDAEIAAEASLRSTGDSTNASAITAEASTRASADTSEASTRAAADTANATAITNEASARASADTAEASARASGDAAVQAASQPVDPDLTAIAALSTTAFGRALLALANNTALQALLSLIDLDATGALTSSANVESRMRLQSVDQLTPPTGNTNWNGQRIFAVADAAAATDALNKRSGAFGKRTAVADAAYVVLTTDRVIGYTSLTANRAVTLPTAAAFGAGTPLTIRDESGNCGTGANIITINRSGSDTIEGLSAWALFAPYVSATIVSDGVSKWTFLAMVPAAPLLGGTGGTTPATSRIALGTEGRTAVADAAYTALATDRTIGFTSITAGRTITLPLANSVNGGSELTIRDESGSCGTGANVITVARQGSDTIEGLTAWAFFAPYVSATFVSDGTSKWIMRAVTPLPILLGGTGALTAAGSRTQLGIEGRTTVADAAYTALATDKLVAFTSLTATRLVTLPLANSFNAGQELVIADESGSCGTGSNIIQFARQGSDTINGGTTTYSLFAPYAAARLVSDGVSKWFIVAEYIYNGGTIIPLTADKNLSDLASAKTARSSTGLNIDGRTTVADAAYTALATDKLVAYTSLSTIRLVTLPLANSFNAGQELVIADESGSCGSGSNIIQFTHQGSDTINGGSATYSLFAPYASARLVSDGVSKWFIVSTYLYNGGTGASIQALISGSNLSDVANAQTANRNISKFGRTTVSDAAKTVGVTDGPVIAYITLTAGRAVTLPSATTAGAGFVLIIKDEVGNANTNNLTVTRAGSDTIEGATTSVINTAFGVLRLYSDGGTKWFKW